jgi:Carboxypeptidase regulatory-like domain
VLPAAQVKLRSPVTGLARTSSSTAQGEYDFPSLPAGEYEVSVEAAGFRRAIRQAVVEAGRTTTADFSLDIGDLKESVAVDSATPLIQYDSHTVGGVVTQGEIQGLPLNGRSFLELAKLEPGVQPPTRQNNNRTFVPVLGATQNSRTTRVTVDGGSIMAAGSGGAQMGFSQDVVQEFQVSTVNFDLSTGITATGAVNVVTRSGTDDLHGAGFYFFRDHKLAGYPALARDTADPDPFFQRRQFGFNAGGPIRHDRFFFFGSWERNEQRGVVATTLLSSDFAALSRITPSPYYDNELSLRLDGRISSKHSAFIRYSHEGGHAFGPSQTTSSPKTFLLAYPSQWTRQLVWADQSLLGLTSVLRPALVNDFRFSYFYTNTSEVPGTQSDCAGCLGLGAPAINIQEAQLFIGDSSLGYRPTRHFHLTDGISWQRGAHRVRFGADWEHHRNSDSAWPNEPATINLFSPDEVRTYNQQASPSMRIPLPATFRTLDDILQLPLTTVTVGIGDPRVPQENGGTSRTWNTLRFWGQDAWRMNRRLTLNYGLGWTMDRAPNYDLHKPALLAPILGPNNLSPTKKNWTNFSPVLGLALAPSPSTVIRAGAGLFYDFLNSGPDGERALLGPPGLGRTNYSGTSFDLCPGVPALSFDTPTSFNGAELLALLPTIRTCLARNARVGEASVQAIQISKQGGTILTADFPNPSAMHASVGIQHEIARNFVLSADVVYRHFVHLMGAPIDLNHYNSVRGPVIPKCAPDQANDPLAICSKGSINVQEDYQRATYRGLLLRADHRFSRRLQILGSYAYSSNSGTNSSNVGNSRSSAGSGFNLDNLLENTGPLPTDVTHLLNIAGVIRLPRQLEASVNFAYTSTPPFSAYVGGIDLNGDGIRDDLLPGTKVNAFNRSMSRADLERLVAAFNQTRAGSKDAQGKPIPTLTLPNHYTFDDNFHSLDLRLTRSFTFRERWRLSLIGEVFNLYNKANLTGYSGDLTTGGFGQPTNRVPQIFGSGGPRAFQLATRISF